MAHIERSANDRVRITSVTVNLENKSLWIDCERQVLDANGQILLKKTFNVSTDMTEFPKLPVSDRKVVTDFIDLLHRIAMTKPLQNEATGEAEQIGGVIK